MSSWIGFNIALTNVDAKLKQSCINVVPTLHNVVSMVCNVVLKLFQCRALMLYQRCATLKIRHLILFHFQCWINVISTLIHNVEKTLIRRWNVGWDRKGLQYFNHCFTCIYHALFQTKNSWMLTLQLY